MANGWTVIAQQQTQTITSTGQLRDTIEVTFQTDGGTTGSVRVPVAGYGPDVVAEAVQPLVDAIAAVAGL